MGKLDRNIPVIVGSNDAVLWLTEDEIDALWEGTDREVIAGMTMDMDEYLLNEMLNCYCEDGICECDEEV